MTYANLGELFEDILRLHQQKAYADALALVERERPGFPQHAARMAYWRMCFLSLLGRSDEAIQVFGEALNAGHWYGESMLREDADLASLQGLPAFEALMARNSERMAAAQASAKAYMQVIEPRADAAAPYPTLIALHGNNSSAALSEERWRPAANRGWLVALPQSTQMAGTDLYQWNDRERAVREVTDHVAALCGLYSTDPDCTVVGGFSMGAQLACWLGLSGALAARGVIAVGPYLPDVESWGPHMVEAARRGLRVFLIIGDADSGCYPQTVTLHEMLLKAGAPSELRVYPGMSHVFPPDFDRVLLEALEFVTDGGSERSVI